MNSFPVLFFQVFPLIFPDLSQEDILNCRLVCKPWNRSVDNYLQNCPESRYLELYPYNLTKMATSINGSPLQKAVAWNHPPHIPVYQPLLRSKNFRSIHFDNTGKLSTFLAKTSTHPRNPFVLRLISLMCCQVDQQDLQAYWLEITDSLLQKFVQEVYHLQICPTIGLGPNRDICSYYERLLKTLWRLPNLKTLHLYRNNDYLPPVSSKEATRIQGYMDMHPLPPLPELETLSEVFMDPLRQELIINQLMRTYSSQLKTISMSITIWREDIPEFSNLPQCTSLYIRLDDCLEKWERLCYQLEAPNLGKLSLNIQTTSEISQIFRPLQQRNFQSLVYLKLHFIAKLRIARSGEEAGDQFLLENVKTLEVSENANAPYDYLLSHLPKLEYILVCFEPGMEKMKDEVFLNDRIFEIRKWMYSEALYKSNIWARMVIRNEF